MATSTRCMVCSAPVQEVIRAPTAQVPLTLFERAETNTQEHWAAIFLQSCRVEDHASVFVEKLVLLRSTFEATSEALSSSVAHIEASSADDRACNMEVATGVFAEQLRILMALLEGDFAMMQSALQSLRAEAPGLVESVRDNTAAGGRQEDEAAARPVEVKAAAETEGTATFSCSPESALTIFEVITPDPPGLSAEMEEAEQRVRDAVHALITTQKVWRALWVSLTLCMEVVSEEKFPAALCALNDGAADSRPEILHAAMVMSGLQSTLKARSTTLGGILEELDAEVDLLRKSFQGPDSLLPSDAKEEQEASLVEQEASLVPRLPGPRGVIAL